jgi:hypothetical protein
MTALSSPVQVCNLALSHLGQPAITSITAPKSESEQVCALWYDVTRQALLREYVWRFAKHRANISRSGTPLFDWASAYTLPPDFLRLLSVKGTIEVHQTDYYDIEDGAILLQGNTATVPLRYIRDVTNVQSWDALFSILMSLTLALNMAYKFTLKKGLLDTLNNRYTLELPKAITVNSQERPPRRIQRSNYLAARRNGSYSGDGNYFTGPMLDTGE